MKNKVKLTAIVLCILSLGMIIAGIILNFNKGNIQLKNNSQEDAFFLEKEGKYAVFNTKGKQVTDFIFTEVKEFYNGSSLVKIDNKVGVINNKGKYVIALGTYDTLYQNHAIFSYSDKNNNKHFVTSKNKKIVSFTKEEVYKENIGTIDFLDYEHGFYSYKKENKIHVIDKDGNKIDTYPEIKDEDIYFSIKKGIINISYNKKTYLYDMDTYKKIITFDNNGRTDITDVSENKKNIIISMYETIDKNEELFSFKIISNGKETGTIKNDYMCKYISITMDNYILCDDYTYEAGTYTNDIYDVFGKKKLDDVIQYFSISKYVKLKTPKEVVDADFIFYDKEKQNKQHVYLMEKSKNKYPIFLGKVEQKTTDTYGYNYYDSSGKILNKEPFYKAESFNKDGTALVSTKEISYFINNKMEKISEEYTKIKKLNIDIENGYYAEGENENQKYIIDNQGKVIASGFNNYSISYQKIIQSNYKDYHIVKLEYDNATKYYFYKDGEFKLKTTINDKNLQEEIYYIKKVNDKEKKYYLYDSSTPFLTL